MKIENEKLKFKSFFQKKLKVLILLLFCFNISMLYCQSFTDLGFGKYQFESVLPEWDLHFWLFDDGYHSFSHEPIHYYGNNAIPSNPILYHAEPYDSDDIDDINLGLITNGGQGFNLNGSILQNQIEIKRSWNLVNSQDNYFLLMFENTKYDEPISGCVEFHFNENQSFITGADILDDYNNNWVGPETLSSSEYEGYTHKFSWSFHNLIPNEQRFIYIPATCKESQMGTVFTRGVLKLDDCDRIIAEDRDNDGSNNGIFDSPIYTLRSVVSANPHDPNIMSSNPTCWTSSVALSQTIRYKLQFQNKGFGPAKDVFTNFRSNVPFGSVVLVEYSDGCILNWDPSGINVGFYGIDLNGLNEDDPVPDYDETIGWIEIDVCYNVSNIENLNIDCIELEAEVIFGDKQPILAYNNVCKKDHCESNYNDNDETGTCIPAPYTQGGNFELSKLSTDVVEVKELNFSLFPNPANHFIKIESNSFEEDSKISISNILGEVQIFKERLNQGENIIDISKLESGVYYIQFMISGKIQSKSFIKI